MLAGIAASIVSVLIDQHSLYDHLKNYYKNDLLKEEDTETIREEVTT